MFCGENHTNSSCEKAKKIPFKERRKLAKDNNCCLKFLVPNHRARNCRVKISCAWCGESHSILVCEKLNNSSNGTASSEGNTSEKIEASGKNLASFCNSTIVYLLTLRVILYSETKEKVALVVIDQGLQRLYIRTDVAKFLGYKSIENREVTHALFGGASSNAFVHDVYSVRMRSLDGKYSCFQVMNQNIICSDIPRIRRADWID